MKKTQYLLLQARKKNDPMIEHEKSCFRRALECGKEELIAIDIIRENIKTHDLKKHPIIIIGGRVRLGAVANLCMHHSKVIGTPTVLWVIDFLIYCRYLSILESIILS